MRLFHILTRHVATGKIKVTQKLVNRVHRETGGKHRADSPHQRKGTHQKFVRSRWGELVAASLLLLCYLTAQGATGETTAHSPAATSGYSAAALFNQANAFARDGRTGPAVLDYERAQLLAPNDADIAANLHFIRAKNGLPDAPDNWFVHCLTYVHPNTQAWLGSLGLVLIGVSMLLLRLKPQRLLVFRSLVFAGVVLVVAAIASAITIWPRVNEAVIITQNTSAWNAPVPTADPAFKLREGETVRVRADRQDYSLVETALGRSGWIARANMARVVPSSGKSAPSVSSNVNHS